MPNNDRPVQLFTSGDRDSGVEHLVHLSKVANAQSDLTRRGAQEPPHPPSGAMVHRHGFRMKEQERAIREGNAIILERIRRQQSDDDRRARNSTIVPAGNQHKGFFQGSNHPQRVQEARRIDQENLALVARLHETKPFVTRQKQMKQDSEHQQLVKRISKFKPQPEFVGASILRPQAATQQQRPHRLPPTENKEMFQRRESGWKDVLRSDVQATRRRDDRMLRNGTLDDEIGAGTQKRVQAQQRRAIQMMHESAPATQHGPAASYSAGAKREAGPPPHQEQRIHSADERPPQSRQPKPPPPAQKKKQPGNSREKRYEEERTENEDDKRAEAVEQREAEEEEARKQAEAEDEARKKREAEEEARKEEEAKQTEAEEKARKQSEADEEARKKRETEEEARKQREAEEEEAQKQAEAEEEARKKREAEEESRKQAEAEEEARKQSEADEEARKKSEAEEEARKQREVEEEEEARKQAEAEEEGPQQAEADAEGDGEYAEDYDEHEVEGDDGSAAIDPAPADEDTGTKDGVAVEDGEGNDYGDEDFE